jgi:hypothetical protein
MSRRIRSATGEACAPFTSRSVPLRDDHEVDLSLDLGQLSKAVGADVAGYTVDEVDPQHRRHSVTGGVYRVLADGFALILKIVRLGHDADPDALWVSGADPTHRNYWKREWLAYSSGLLDALPGELRSPRMLLATEPADDECWIWMEDVEGRPGATWRIDDYDSVAFDLGSTQAAYASGRSVLPTQDWLSRLWLRGWVDTVGKQITTLDDDAMWAPDPLAEMRELRPRIRAVWQARDELLGIVEGAPQTIVHLDFWPTNLIAADDGSTVAIDWSQVGIGAVGQDLDQLILDPVWMQVLPDASLDALQTHVLRGYAAGLRSSGFDVGETDVQRWYAAAAAVHYAPLAALQAVTAGDPALVRESEQHHSMPYPAIVANRTRVLTRAVELAESVLDAG